MNRAAPRVGALLGASLALMLTGATASAQSGEVQAFLGAVLDHPGLQAAAEARSAAAHDLAALRVPYALEGSVAFSRIVADPAEFRLPDPLDDLQQTPDGWNSRVQLDLSLRPFLYGDLSDAETNLAIQALRAERSVLETQARLEVAALTAATGLRLAQRGRRLAEASVALARDAEGATARQHRLGAATDADLRRAEAALARAEDALRSSQRRLLEAERQLRDLVGDARPPADLPDPLDWPAIDAPDPAVLTAEEDLVLARLGVSAAERDLLPVLQVAYSAAAGDGSLTLSLETRTLQPSIGYRYPGEFADAGAGLLPDDYAPNMRSALTVAATFRLNPADGYQRDAALARVRAAEAGLRNTAADADRARHERADALRAAEAEVRLAELELELARADAADADRRLAAGLTVLLAVAERNLAVAEAELALDAARLSLLSARLRSYADLGVPPSEVLP